MAKKPTEEAPVVDWQKLAGRLTAEVEALKDDLKQARAERDTALRDRDNQRDELTKAKTERDEHKNRAYGLGQRVEEYGQRLRSARLHPDEMEGR